MTSRTVKTSVGVALCRHNPKTGTPEVLLVRARCTYQFTSFAFGRNMRTPQRVVYRFNHMTEHEKVLVWSCDFARIWYHIWLRVPTAETALTERDRSYLEFYNNCRTKFEQMVARYGVDRMRAMLTGTKACELGWEVPKGGVNAGESEIEGALRELTEETGVPSHALTMLSVTHPICTSHQDENVTYNQRYWVAWAADAANELDYQNRDQVSEVGALAWWSLADVRGLPAQLPTLCTTVRQALARVRRVRRTGALQLDV